MNGTSVRFMPASAVCYHGGGVRTGLAERLTLLGQPLNWNAFRRIDHRHSVRRTLGKGYNHKLDSIQALACMLQSSRIANSNPKLCVLELTTSALNGPGGK